MELMSSLIFYFGLIELRFAIKIFFTVGINCSKIFMAHFILFLFNALKICFNTKGYRTESRECVKI